MGASSASAAVFIDDFTGFPAAAVTSFQAGGDQQQVITTSVGSAEAGVPAIDGTSVFMTIDTTNTPPVGSGSYGGGLRVNLDPASLTAGGLTSSDPADYNILFDVAANGFAPNNVDVFMRFFDDAGLDLIGQIGINQNNAVFAPFITQLGLTDDPVSVSIGLDNFTTGDVSALATADSYQFQFFTRSLDANYSDDAGNVLVLDNVGIEQVPEPGAALLLGFGSLFLMLGRRRKA